MVSRLQSKSLYDLRPKIGSFVYSRESIDLVSVRGREGRESQTAGRIYRSQGQLERPRASLIKWKTPTPSSGSFTEEPQAPEESFTEELQAPEESFTEELQAPEESFTEELQAPEESFTEELQAPEESLTEEPQAPEGCRRQPFTAAL